MADTSSRDLTCVDVHAPDVSVVVPTYNRSASLEQALRSLFSQKTGGVSFEIVVVDNNSSDGTPQTVAALGSESPVALRYCREVRQGNAFARNAGVEQAEAAIIAFLDDDVLADETWVCTIKATLDRHPQLSLVGGRILPRWKTDPPSWLTPSQWAPLALLDYGAEALDIAGPTPRGLLTANIGIRKEVFDQLGGFLPALQRVQGSIGSMEDHEFLLRICRNGRRGRYVPDLVTWAPVDPERTTKAYHRRWHTGHGSFYAVLNDPEWERSRFSLLGVPGHLYRKTMGHAISWCANVLRGSSDAAFVDECELRFFRGFIRQRQRRRAEQVRPGP
jgi:glycosyltransferase involved in cell wall biosynthesis